MLCDEGIYYSLHSYWLLCISLTWILYCYALFKVFLHISLVEAQRKQEVAWDHGGSVMGLRTTPLALDLT